MRKSVSFLLILFFLSMRSLNVMSAEPEPESEKQSFLSPIVSSENTEFNGRFKNNFGLYVPDSDSFLQPAGTTQTLWHYNTNLRLIGRYFIDTWGEIEAHSETIYLRSELRRKSKRLEHLGTSDALSSINFSAEPTDRTRLMDLTFRMNASDSQLLINRFDRLTVTLRNDNAVLRMGRQAVTWGHGFLFNPMDIFAPFSPTQIDRDYKQGEDAVSLETWLGQYGDLQFLYLPRRNAQSGHVRFDESSVAVKYHIPITGTETEFTAIGGKHFEDTVLGAGMVGYLVDAAWRVDVAWTYLDDSQTGFTNAVANLDYSWVWWGLNWYGWVEYYYNGLGEARKNYEYALVYRPLVERIVRGEIFVLGRHYIDTSLRVEIHPLVNIYFNTITNFLDPSGIFQPYLVWDVKENIQFNLSGTLYWGEKQSEYGGFLVDGSELVIRQPHSIFVWVNVYF